jgi:pimeloyl-ACP methyl ester carboxylesterase
MRDYIDTIPVDAAVRALPALFVEPDSKRTPASVLLFLHGKGEAGSRPSDLRKVCEHQTPPFQALLGRLPETVVVAPQAPPFPTELEWDWCEYMDGIAEFLAKRFAKRRLVATGFSRGGLGVLRLIAAHPKLLQAWALVDPQPPRDGNTKAILAMTPAVAERGWLRYGRYRKLDKWKAFSADLAAKLPAANRDTIDLEHVEMSLQAYNGAPLSAMARTQNLYDFLAVKFDVDASAKQRRRGAGRAPGR